VWATTLGLLMPSWAAVPPAGDWRVECGRAISSRCGSGTLTHSPSPIAAGTLPAGLAYSNNLWQAVASSGVHTCGTGGGDGAVL
jgi:hypothetical protein